MARIVAADSGETQSLARMQGQVSRQGQVRITFTTPVGSTITGGGGTYTTNGAQMLRACEGITPPDPAHTQGEQKNARSSAYRNGCVRGSGSSEQRAGLASVASQAWPATPLLSGIRGLDRSLATISGVQDGLQISGWSDTWPE